MNLQEAVERFLQLSVDILESDARSKQLRFEQRNLGKKIHAKVQGATGDKTNVIKFACGSRQLEIRVDGELIVLGNLQELPTELEI